MQTDLELPDAPRRFQSADRFAALYQAAAEDQRYEARASFTQISSKVSARRTQANATAKGRNCLKTAAKPLGGSKSSLGQAARAATCHGATRSCTQPALSPHPLSPPTERTSAGRPRVTAGRGQASLLCSSRNNLFNIYTLWHGSVYQHCPVANPKHNNILWSWQTACTVTPKAVVIKCNSNVI